MNLIINPKDGIKAASHRKENHFYSQKTLMAIEDGEIRVIAELRFYATSATTFACLWLHSSKGNVYCNGSGSAGGFGYHRASAAAQAAFKSAGIIPSEDIGGAGNDAIEKVLIALSEKLGYNNAFIHNAHA